MFLLQELPAGILEYIVFGILGFGFVATVICIFFINPLLRLIPSIAGTYQLIQMASVVIFLLGIYLWGSFSTEMKWRDRVKEAETKAQIAEERYKKTNDELTIALAQRDHAVATRGKNIIKETIKYLEGSPTTHTQTLNLSAQERAELEAKIAELQRAERECPVPKLVTEAINNASVKENTKK